MALDEFKSITRFRVAFCDIDMLQHVNNAAYVVWAETARCVYHAEVLGELLTGANGIIVAKLEVNLRASAYVSRAGCHWLPCDSNWQEILRFPL